MTFPGSPRLLKGGIVLIDPVSSAVKRIIALQYNPDTLNRTLRLKEPPIETMKLACEINVSDR